MDYEATGTTEQGQGERGSRTQLGWNCGRGRYACGDERCIEVPRRTASVRDLDETKTVPRNMIRYTTSKGEVKATISGIEYGRNRETVFGGPDDIRTVIFPDMVRIIRQGSFYGVKSLVSIVLNEGLERIGRS